MIKRVLISIFCILLLLVPLTSGAAPVLKVADENKVASMDEPVNYTEALLYGKFLLFHAVVLNHYTDISINGTMTLSLRTLRYDEFRVFYHGNFTYPPLLGRGTTFLSFGLFREYLFEVNVTNTGEYLQVKGYQILGFFIPFR